ncbi:MAG TPA: CRISPR-associated endonuclease Cas2 [Planctomicrobium sp.]|nr:CRISPR-associated endonuclease Cas2 [Planctomicrobium sp.]
MAQAESTTVVLYDIPHDRTRVKVSEKCLDFGLVRFQYSAFQGPLTRNRREELALILEHLVEIHGGAIALFPVCAADSANWINIHIEPPPVEKPILKLVTSE